MISPTFNTDLVDDLAREKVVLFLGAGVSASAVTASGGRIAGWEAFLRKVCDAAPQEIKIQALALIDRKDYLLACEILQLALAEEWGRLLAVEFGQKATPSKLHEAIMRLQQRIIVTTNLDKLLEAAWDSAPGADTHYPTVISSVNSGVFRSLKDHSSRYIIKLHGTIDDEKSLVFSRSEYIRLAFGNANYSAYIENLLLNYTFLFVGFSMDDPAIISLMEMYALRYPSSRGHWMITSQSIEPNLVDVFKKMRKLSFISYDERDNHAELPPLIEKVGEAAKARRREIYASSIDV